MNRKRFSLFSLLIILKLLQIVSENTKFFRIALSQILENHVEEVLQYLRGFLTIINFCFFYGPNINYITYQISILLENSTLY